MLHALINSSIMLSGSACLWQDAAEAWKVAHHPLSARAAARAGAASGNPSDTLFHILLLCSTAVGLSSCAKPAVCCDTSAC